MRGRSEVSEISKAKDEKFIHRTHEKARSIIDKANDNEFHKRRVMAATMAMQAFTLMFCANTGMGLSQIIDLPEIQGLEVGNNQQGFKSIKYRAFNREVYFKITSDFMNSFKLFLRLRKYLLDSVNFESFRFLFFNIKNATPCGYSMDLSHHFNKRIRECFNIELNVSTRMWRAFKSDWLIRKTDVQSTAILLQNSPGTVLKHYAEGSRSQADEELTGFFEKFDRLIVEKRSPEILQTAAGNCASGEPKPEVGSPIEPNCSTPEGCLFCEKYRVHSDGKDYRKLISFKYVINVLKTLAKDDEQFYRIQGKVIARIDEITKKIIDSGRLEKEVAKNVEKEVLEYEELDLYWGKKLQLIDDLVGV